MDEILAAVLRTIVGGIFDLLLWGPGYLLLRWSGSTDMDPDGLAALLAGIAFWGVLGAIVWVAFFR
jgi:hypothetical protein